MSFPRPRFSISSLYSVLLLTGLVLSACQSGVVSSGPTPYGAPPQANPPPVSPPANPAPSTLVADGAACDSSSDCASGLCEGEGCGEGQGVCVAKVRTCTKDIAVFCACDGQSFHGSSSCPGGRFASRGACEKKEDGSPCLRTSDCQSGVCEGQGCGRDQAGTCAPARRICTRDMQTYCGCDGQTFQGSGSCPGKRYLSRGECTADAVSPVADGGNCLRADECQSGVCEGQGCGDDAPGLCVSTKRMCTRDFRQYCGCDGATFGGSGSCPGKRFSKPGPCQ